MMRLVRFMTARIEANSRFVCPVGDRSRNRFAVYSCWKGRYHREIDQRWCGDFSAMIRQEPEGAGAGASHLTLPRNGRTV
jgi:hypothetical protein